MNNPGNAQLGTPFFASPMAANPALAAGIMQAGQSIGGAIDYMGKIQMRRDNAAGSLDALKAMGAINEDNYNQIAGQSVGKQEGYLGVMLAKTLADQAAGRQQTLQQTGADAQASANIKEHSTNVQTDIDAMRQRSVQAQQGATKPNAQANADQNPATPPPAAGAVTPAPALNSAGQAPGKPMQKQLNGGVWMYGHLGDNNKFLPGSVTITPTQVPGVPVYPQ